MRVLVGHFYHESNTFCPSMTQLSDFEVHDGPEMLPLLPGVDVLLAAGAEVVPSVYAARWSSGTVTREAYDVFEGMILRAIEREQPLDGVFLSLHGGMTVEGIGSGEYSLLKSVRGAVGDVVPIAVSLDMHANNRSGIEALVNIMTGYHTAPHTDAQETQRKAARALLAILADGQRVHPCLARAKMLLVGERALSQDEPFRTIFERCRKLESDDRFLAATLFVGMAWGDTADTTVTAVVTPSRAEHAPLARMEADWMAQYLFAHRNECRYAHPSYMPEEAVRRALKSANRPLYLSDSGDNPTAGGVGDTTVLLRLFSENPVSKQVLFAPILDASAVSALALQPAGATLPISIGSGRDADSAPVRIAVTVIRSGELFARHGLSLEKAANFVLVRHENLHIVLVDAQMAFTGMECFESAGLQVSDYDIVVLKMGYMFDEIAAPCRENIMALTPGCTPLLITADQYHNLPRPIWPLDEV